MQSRDPVGAALLLRRGLGLGFRFGFGSDICLGLRFRFRFRQCRRGRGRIQCRLGLLRGSRRGGLRRDGLPGERLGVRHGGHLRKPEVEEQAEDNCADGPPDPRSLPVRRRPGVKLHREYDLTAPRGVAGRNSDNTFIKKMLKWEPNPPLDTGLRATYKWIRSEYKVRKAGKRVVD